MPGGSSGRALPTHTMNITCARPRPASAARAQPRSQAPMLAVAGCPRASPRIQAPILACLSPPPAAPRSPPRRSAQLLPQAPYATHIPTLLRCATLGSAARRHLRGDVALPGGPAGEHLVHQDRERVHVGRRAEPAVAQQLRGLVCHGACRAPARGLTVRVRARVEVARASGLGHCGAPWLQQTSSLPGAGAAARARRGGAQASWGEGRRARRAMGLCGQVLSSSGLIRELSSLQVSRRAPRGRGG